MTDYQSDQKSEVCEIESNISSFSSIHRFIFCQQQRFVLADWIRHLFNRCNTCKHTTLIINKVQKSDSQCACSWVIRHDLRFWCRLSTEINFHQNARQHFHFVDFDYWFKIFIRLSDSSEHHRREISDDWCHDSVSILWAQRDYWDDLNTRDQ